MDFEALGVTLRLAIVTTLILLVVAMPLAWWLAHGRSRWRAAVELLTTLPLVLPPTVLGFYLLWLLGPLSAPGLVLTRWIGHPLTFTFNGLVIGSVIYSLPFAVQPLRAGFSSVPLDWLDTAATLGANARQRFWRIVLPSSRLAIAGAGALVFVHTVGEFGVVLMLGGNIPGATRTLSLVVYDQVQDFRYAAANLTSLLLVAISLLGLLAIYVLRMRGRRD
jgi:molybdate transport system permease protein